MAMCAKPLCKIHVSQKCHLQTSEELTSLGKIWQCHANAPPCTKRASFIAACKIHDVSNVISLHIACRINLIKRHICKRLRHVKCQIMKEIRTLLLLVTKLIHIWRPLRYFIKNTKEIGRLIDLKYENRCCFLFNYFFHNYSIC